MTSPRRDRGCGQGLQVAHEKFRGGGADARWLSERSPGLGALSKDLLPHLEAQGEAGGGFRSGLGETRAGGGEHSSPGHTRKGEAVDGRKRVVRCRQVSRPGRWEGGAVFQEDGQAGQERLGSLESSSSLCSENTWKTQNPHPQQNSWC